MQIKVYENAAEFYQQVEPFLMAHEAENCVMLGVCTMLIKMNDSRFPPYLAYVEDEGKIVGVATRTPPYNLLLSYDFDPRAMPDLATHVRQTYDSLNGVTAASAVGKTFVEVWHEITGQAYRLNIAERLYRLTKVNSINGVSGENRPPKPEERDLLVQWLIDFSDEALDGISREDAERNIDQRYEYDPALRGLRVWCDEGKVVSFAGYGGPTPHGIRIGPVYTPPELRGRGYASACVAAMTQELLDGGRTHCTLFTDLSNPTSNYIYQNIGYEPVCDVDEYRFGSAG